MTTFLAMVNSQGRKDCAWHPPILASARVKIALVASAALTLYLGILPARLLDWAAQSIQTIF